MKRTILYTTLCLIVLITVNVFTVELISQEEGIYISGGRNIEAEKYTRPQKYPPFPDKARFIGSLKGDWYEMGKQFGEKSGKSTGYVSDIWWKEMCKLWGKEETLKAFKLYEAQISAFDPHLVEFMKGISDGASRWLDKSPYSDKDNPFYATNYQRVLAVNLWDEWIMLHPRMFPDGSGTFGGSRKAPAETCVAGCSAFAVRGRASMNGEVISAHNRHSAFSPRCWEQVYVIDPPNGNRCWVLTNSPQVAANQVVNEKGVSISLLYGGSTNPRSLDYNGESYCAEGFGVPWFHLFLYAGTHANTAEEAIEMLTTGTQAYRERTGRKTLLRGGGWNFLVADNNTLAVVEATANRYAVRYSGDVLPFTGPDLNDPDYIVVTNHFICDFSYDKDNNRTNIPMTIFSDGYTNNSSTGEITGLDGSGERFWTLMWDVKHNYGKIDRYRTQQIMSGYYRYEKDTGEKIEVVQNRRGDWRILGYLKACTLGGMFNNGGTCDSKIAVLDDNNIIVNWTMGSPRDWQGAWDEYWFRE